MRRLPHLKKSLLAMFALSVLTGCVQITPRTSGQAADNYFAQPVYADNTPLQSWQEMRQESEIKEVFEEDWTDKLQRMEKANAARSKKNLKAAPDKGAKPNKTADQPAPAKPRQDGKSQSGRK